MRNPLVVSLMIILALACFLLRYAGQGKAPHGLQSLSMTGDLTGEQVYGSYTVRVYRLSRAMNNDDQGKNASYEILKNGQRVYAERDGCEFFIGSFSPNPLTEMGKDVTGDGLPNLVIENWSGAASGGGYFVVFQLARTFVKLLLSMLLVVVTSVIWTETATLNS